MVNRMQNPAVMNQFGQTGMMWSMGHHHAPIAAPMTQMVMGAGRMAQPSTAPVHLQNHYLPPGPFSAAGSTSGLVPGSVGMSQPAAHGGMQAHNKREDVRRMQLQKQSMMPAVQLGMPHGHSSVQGHMPMVPAQPPMSNHSVHMGMQSVGQRSTHALPLGAPVTQMVMGAGRMAQPSTAVLLQNHYLPPGQFAAAGSTSGLVPGSVGMSQPAAHGGMAHNKMEEARRMQLQKQGVMMSPGQPPMKGMQVMGQRSTPPVPLGAPMNQMMTYDDKSAPHVTQMVMGAGRMAQPSTAVLFQNHYLPPAGSTSGPRGGNQAGGAQEGMSHKNKRSEEVRWMELQKQQQGCMMPIQPGLPQQGHAGMGHLPMAYRQPQGVPSADPYISRTTRANKKMINGMQNPGGGVYGL